MTTTPVSLWTEKYKEEFPMDRGWAWVVCGATFLTMFIASCANQMLAVVLLDFIEEFDTTLTTASLIFLFKVFSVSFMAILSVNYLIPKFGARVVCTTSAFIYFVCGVSRAFTTSVAAFILLTAVRGMMLGVMLVPCIVLVGFYFTKYRSIATTITMGGASAASICWPRLTRYILSVYGLQGTLLLNGALDGNMIALVMLLRPVSHYRKPKTSTEYSSDNSSKPIEITPFDPQPSHAIEDTNKDDSIIDKNFPIPYDDQRKSLIECVNPPTDVNYSNRLHDAPSSRDHKTLKDGENPLTLASNMGRNGIDNSKVNPSGANINTNTKSQEHNHNDNIMSSEVLFRSDIDSFTSKENIPYMDDFHPSPTDFLLKLKTVGQFRDKDRNTNNNDHKDKDNFFLMSSINSNGSKKPSNGLYSQCKLSVTVPEKDLCRATSSEGRRETTRFPSAWSLPTADFGVFTSQMEGIEDGGEADQDDDGRLSCWQKVNKVFDFSFFRRWTFTWLMVALVLGGTSLLFSTHLPTIAIFKGATKDEGALLLTILGVVDLCSRMGFAFLADSKVVRVTTIIGLSGCCLGVVCAFSSVYTDMTSFVVMSVLLGLFAGIRISLATVLLVEVFGLETLAKTLSLYHVCVTLSLTAHNPLVGSMLESYGSDVVMYLLGSGLFVGGVMIASVPLVGRLEERYKSRRQLQDTKDPLS